MSKQKFITSEILVDTATIFSDFKNHVATEGNANILFSGKYGTGKSYFLNSFFNEETIKKKYNVITISPVHYVVSPNEDIFELIKVDILMNLFVTKKIDFIDGDYSFSKITVVTEYLKYIKNRPGEILVSLAKCVSKISAQVPKVGAVIDQGLEFLKGFKKFEDKLNKTQKPIGNKSKEFIEEMYEKLGSYIEFNFISQIIKEVLNTVATKEKKENVLVIEDFDRLDPAHIFRILNIFSAHSHLEEGNKFGFDKVIIVCDLRNIKSLYEHMYGSKIDFNGYMDKFYSYHPFYFDNRKALFSYFRNGLKIDIPDYGIGFLVDLLIRLVNNDVVTLRKIMKTKFVENDKTDVFLRYRFEALTIDKSKRFPVHIDNQLDSINLYRGDVPLITIIQFLKVLFGGYNDMTEALNKISNFGIDKNESVEIVKLFAIPLKLTETLDKHYRIFFENLESFQYPSHQINTIKIRYNLAYQNSKYDGVGSYFKDCAITNVSADYHPLAMDDVLSWLKKITSKCRNEGWIF